MAPGANIIFEVYVVILII